MANKRFQRKARREVFSARGVWEALPLKRNTLGAATRRVRSLGGEMKRSTTWVASVGLGWAVLGSELAYEVASAVAHLGWPPK